MNNEMGYLKFLPALFQENSAQQDLLERFLALHENVLAGLEKSVTDLSLLFDPGAAPDGEELPSWLSWLASWLAFDLNENWSETQTREYIAAAFELYGMRGTVDGLRRYLKLYADVEAHIEEPGLATHIWTLGETSVLGFTTMLAPAHPQGAVVGTSATLGQSHLVRGEAFGAPLFEDLAHHFCIKVYCAELNRPGALDDVRSVIDREKPAHTDYHLCVIEPRMRVGVQAQLGIDTIIAKGPRPAQTGTMLEAGVLSDAASPCITKPIVSAGEPEVCQDEEDS